MKQPRIHQRRRKRLNVQERCALIAAANFVLAGDWPWGTDEEKQQWTNGEFGREHLVTAVAKLVPRHENDLT